MSKRIQKIVSALRQCNTLADVGCDHGYVGLTALTNGIAKKVIFIDVSLPSLQKAKANCPENLHTCATFMNIDGLQDVTADQAVIAGMGGLETINILQNAHTLPSLLVLQPMRNVSDVRTCLAKNYVILTDEKFFDGKYYDLIVAQKQNGGEHLSADELAYGKTNLQSPSADFVNYLKQERQTLDNVYSLCKDQSVLARLKDVERILQALKENKK